MTKQRVSNFDAEDWRRNFPNFREPLLSRNLELVERLRDIGQAARTVAGRSCHRVDSCQSRGHRGDCGVPQR